MASHAGVFGYTAYCASKHALKGFTESLYFELKPQMVPKEPVEVIVRDTMKAIRSGRYHTITGFNARLAGLAVQYFPRLTRKLGEGIIRKASRGT